MAISSIIYTRYLITGNIWQKYYGSVRNFKKKINKVIRISENKLRKDVINLLKIWLVLFYTSVLII